MAKWQDNFIYDEFWKSQRETIKAKTRQQLGYYIEDTELTVRAIELERRREYYKANRQKILAQNKLSEEARNKQQPFWVRTCPICQSDVLHISREACQKAKRKNQACNKCAIPSRVRKRPKQYRKSVSIS